MFYMPSLLSHPQFISCKWPTQEAGFYLFLPPGVSGHSGILGAQLQAKFIRLPISSSLWSAALGN